MAHPLKGEASASFARCFIMGLAMNEKRLFVQRPEHNAEALLIGKRSSESGYDF